MRSFRAALPPERLEAIIEAVISKALDGDTSAAKLLLDRVVPAREALTIEQDDPTGQEQDDRGTGDALRSLSPEDLHELAAAGALKLGDSSTIPTVILVRMAREQSLGATSPGRANGTSSPPAGVSGAAWRDQLDSRFRRELEAQA